MYSVRRSQRENPELENDSIPRAVSAVLLCCLAAFACQAPSDDAMTSDGGAPPPEGTPRLVLMIVVDQLGSAEFERIAPFFTAGYRRMIDNGVVFARSVHQHARSETGPGHATISTGQFPRDHGIVTNWYVEPGLPEIIWAGDDDEFDKSPHRLMVPAVGDWIKQRYPTAKVFTASAKARAAIMLGGKNADAAFWWEEENGLMETSPYYDAPEWFEAFNDQRLASAFYGKVWNPLPLTDEALAELEIEELNQGPLRPGFPHVFGGLRPAPVETFYDDLWGSPWLDTHVTQLAHEILEQEHLGTDEVPDLLALSFSMSDTIGHRFGPHSREYVDILLRQDELVGELLERIDEQVGLENTVVVLTSDHGVVPVPEILQRRGKPGARVDWQILHCVHRVTVDLAEEHDVPEWLIAGSFLAPDLAERTGKSELELEQLTAKRLEQCPAVEKVWTDSELTDPAARERPSDTNDDRWLFANSYYPGRSAEFQIRFREYLMRSRGSLTTHGTSYLYDRQVPVVFMVPGTEAARRGDVLATVDIAPTLATLLDVPVPDGIDGADRSQLLRP